MNNPLINPGLGTFFWMLVSFGVLVFILGKWGWPMLLKALKKREKAIADSLAAAEKAREEMAQLVAHNDDLLKEAKLQRDELLRNARLTSEKIVEDARLKATEEADRIVESARESINYEKLRAMTDKEEAQKLYPAVQKMLDKLAKNNIIHKNKAANLKSSLALHIKNLGE